MFFYSISQGPYAMIAFPKMKKKNANSQQVRQNA